jgi:hypothetical protein
MKTETLPTGTLSVRFEFEKKSQPAEDMQDTLFPSLPITKSPKLLWMERYHIATLEHEENDEGHTWTAYLIDGDRRIQRSAKSEDAALTALALAAGIKLWNEEGA